jgi:hypothetical protein
MKPKYEPTETILQQLTQTASELPEMIKLDADGKNIMHRVRRSGKDLLKAGRLFVGTERVFKGKFYDVFEYEFVNHYNEMVAIYKNEGPQGVENYINGIKAKIWKTMPLRIKIKSLVKSLFIKRRKK